MLASLAMGPSVRPAGLAALVVAIAACRGRTYSLGDKDPRPYHFDPPQIVAELASNARTDNPTLTADLLEIYFTSDRVSGNGDVWVARRSDPALPFDPPTAVTEVNSRRVRDQLRDLGGRPDAVVRFGPGRRRRHDGHLDVEPAEPIRGLVDAASTSSR